MAKKTTKTKAEETVAENKAVETAEAVATAAEEVKEEKKRDGSEVGG